MNSIKKREDARKLKLQEAVDEQERILKRLAEPDMQKDKSENSEYDTYMEKLRTVQMLIKSLMSGDLAPYVPGTYNVEDILTIRYLKIVSYGEERPLPESDVVIKLVDFFDITELPPNIDVTKQIMPITTNSHLGSALINKAHTHLRYNTDVGYCEIEVVTN